MKTSFSGHEKFDCKHSWLPLANKDIKALYNNIETSIAITGLGSNKIKSLKQWLSKFTLINTQEFSKNTQIIFDNDPYLEKLATLCILHIYLSQNSEKATLYFLFFNEFFVSIFTKLALFHIFSKHFQNQRSVFSFLSTQEPHSFQDFIKQDINSNVLYTLDYLFDYINYLANAYTVNMTDKESWILANDYIDSANVLNDSQVKIIKAVALISSFGLEHLIQLDNKLLALAFNGIKNIPEEIRELESKGLILYKRLTHSYALIEETTININEELNGIINDLVNPRLKPIGMKQQFKQMINHEASENLQIEKFPPQIAIAA